MAEEGGGLQVNEDLTFQRREWRIQRAGWFVLCVFIAAALLGLFGDGPLSHAITGEPGAPFRVEYERFVRRGAAERLSIHFAPPAAPRTALELRVSRPYFDSLRVEHVNPLPDAVEVGPTEVVLRFTGEDARSSTIVLDLEPLVAGRHVATFASAGAPTVTLTQFVYF